VSWYLVAKDGAELGGPYKLRRDAIAKRKALGRGYGTARAQKERGRRDPPHRAHSDLLPGGSTRRGGESFGDKSRRAAPAKRRARPSSAFPGSLAGGTRRALANPTRLALEDTGLSVWEERDRAHVRLYELRSDRTLAEWWDDEVWQAVDDGFLERRNLHRSAYEYARHVGAIR
jgi:hypothetical protein